MARCHNSLLFLITAWRQLTAPGVEGAPPHFDAEYKVHVKYTAHSYWINDTAKILSLPWNNLLLEPPRYVYALAAQTLRDTCVCDVLGGNYQMITLGNLIEVYLTRRRYTHARQK